MAKINLIQKPHVDGFAKVWNYKGLSIPLEEAHLQFALDFSNVMLSSFIEQQAKAVLAAKQAAEEKAKSLIVEV